MYYIVMEISELYVLSFHLHRAVPNVENVPHGLKHSNMHSMTVIFLAIVPLDIWEWDDSSSIYIRFGHSEFGDWKFDAGPGRKHRSSLYVCVCVIQYVLLFGKFSLLINFHSHRRVRKLNTKYSQHM